MDGNEWSKRAAALANRTAALASRVRTLETITDLKLWERNAAHVVIALASIESEATVLEACEVSNAASTIAACITTNVPFVQRNLLSIPRAFQAAEPHLIALFTASVALERMAIDGRPVTLASGPPERMTIAGVVVTLDGVPVAGEPKSRRRRADPAEIVKFIDDDLARAPDTLERVAGRAANKFGYSTEHVERIYRHEKARTKEH